MLSASFLLIQKALNSRYCITENVDRTRSYNLVGQRAPVVSRHMRVPATYSHHTMYKVTIKMNDINHKFQNMEFP